MADANQVSMTTMRKWWGVGGVPVVRRTALCGLMLMAGMLPLRPAKACSTALPPASLLGYPEDGAVEVPTDVIPSYDRVFGRLGSVDPGTTSIQLVGDNGDTVAATARFTYVWNFEIVPERSLTPLTRYTLQGHWIGGPPSPVTPVDISIAFTTGGGPVSVPPAAPMAQMQHYQIKGVSLTSCDPFPAGTCVAVPAATAVQATHVDDLGQEDQYVYLYNQSFMTNLSGIDQGTPFVCVRLRTRAANGSLSEPVELCGKDARSFEVHTAKVGCSSEGLTADGHAVSSVALSDAHLAAGCAVGGEGTGASASAVTAWFVLLSLAVARAAARARR